MRRTYKMKKWFTLVLLIFMYQAACPQVIKIVTVESPPPGTSTGDTVYYSKERPLKWADFTGNINRSSTMAAVSFTGFSYDAAIQEKADTILVQIFLQVYFVKDGSWFSPGQQNAYALAHEQLHFDIAKLMEEQFKDSLHLKQFDPEYYPIEIHWLYWDYWRKMNKIQEEYDAETGNGRNRAKQAQWNDKITHALKAFD